MKKYIDRLQEEWERKTSMLCFGMDPVVERMNIDQSKNLSDEITSYFSRILHEISGRVTAVKPNSAYYLQYGNEGMDALVRLVACAKSYELPVIIDAKCGDIGRTSKAYARFVFDVIGGDAVTLNPYMGYDTLEPFLPYTDRGFYVLALTSNSSAKDFQYRLLEKGEHLYNAVIDTVCQWTGENNGVGAVIGATQEAFGDVVAHIQKNNTGIPLLIPGVGAQGGSYAKIKEILEKLHYSKGIVRINSSSAISYAHERFPSYSVEEAAYLAVEEIMKG